MNKKSSSWLTSCQETFSLAFRRHSPFGTFFSASHQISRTINLTPNTLAIICTFLQPNERQRLAYTSRAFWTAVWTVEVARQPEELREKCWDEEESTQINFHRDLIGLQKFDHFTAFRRSTVSFLNREFGQPTGLDYPILVLSRQDALFVHSRLSARASTALLISLFEQIRFLGKTNGRTRALVVLPSSTGQQSDDAINKHPLFQLALRLQQNCYYSDGREREQEISVQILPDTLHVHQAPAFCVLFCSSFYFLTLASDYNNVEGSSKWDQIGHSICKILLVEIENYNEDAALGLSKFLRIHQIPLLAQSSAICDRNKSAPSTLAINSTEHRMKSFVNNFKDFYHDNFFWLTADKILAPHDCSAYMEGRTTHFWTTAAGNDSQNKIRWIKNILETSLDTKLLLHAIIYITKPDNVQVIANNFNQQFGRRVRILTLTQWGGQRDQAHCGQILSEFIAEPVSVLIMNDQFLCGLSLGRLDFVINYDWPEDELVYRLQQRYVRRFGQTKHTHAELKVLSFCTQDVGNSLGFGSKVPISRPNDFFLRGL